MQDKKLQYVYRITDDCPMGHSDALTFGGYVSLSRGTGPITASALSHHTGLDIHTVTQSSTRLTQWGLIHNGCANLTNEQGWFTAKPDCNGRFHKFNYWRSYVRAEASPLTVPTISVASFLILDSRDDMELNKSYLAKVINLDRGTVANAFDELQKVGLLTMDDGTLTINDPTILAEHLADKGQTTRTGFKVKRNYTQQAVKGNDAATYPAQAEGSNVNLWHRIDELRQQGKLGSLTYAASLKWANKLDGKVTTDDDICSAIRQGKRCDAELRVIQR
jgi:DNA-binding MarR family transcriptional regulator